MIPSSDVLFETRSLLLAAGAIAIVAAAIWGMIRYRAERGRENSDRAPHRSRPTRLSVVDSLDIDARRRLVILRCDSAEHLVMIGGPNDVLVDANIARAAGGGRATPREAEREERAPPLSAVSAAPAVDREPEPAVPAAARTVPQATTLPHGAGTRYAPSPTGFEAPVVPPPPVPAMGGFEPRPSVPPPPRRTPSPVQPQASRSTPPRGVSPARAGAAQRSEKSREDKNAGAARTGPRTSLATPFLRPATPRPPQDEDMIPAADDPVETREPIDDLGSDLEKADRLRLDTGPAPGAAQAPAEAAESAAEAPLAGPAEAEGSPKAREAPEQPAAAGRSPDPIDRLEAEIARLLGREPKQDGS